MHFANTAKFTVLMNASARGHIGVVNLSQFGASVNLASNIGCTALMCAS